MSRPFFVRLTDMHHIAISWVFLALVIVGVAGCPGTEPNRSTNRPDTKADPKRSLPHPLDDHAKEKLRRLSANMALSNRVSAAVYQELLQMRRRHGDSPLVIDALIQANKMRDDWEGLATLLQGLPSNQRNLQLLAEALIKTSRFEEAIDLLLANKTGWKKGEREWLLAFSYFHNGEFSEATKLLDGLIETAIDNNRLVQVLVLRGLAAMKFDQIETAKTSLERAVELAPTNVSALVALASVLNQAGDAERAKAIDQRAMVARQTETETTTMKMRMVALGAALEEAWQRQDFARTEQIIQEMMPHVEPSQKAILEEYRVEMMVRRPMPGNDKKW